MSEDNRTNRPDYRVSVEAGLRRLESEKLSFLGASRVISKFDPDSIEEFSQLDEDDDDDVTIHEEINSDELLSGSGKTLDDFRRVQSGEYGLEEAQDSGIVQTDVYMQKLGEPSSSVQSVSDIASIFDSKSSQVPVVTGMDEGCSTLRFSAYRDCDSLGSLSSLESESDLDASDTKDVSDIAAQIRHRISSEEDADLEFGETKNVADIASEIRKDAAMNLHSADLESCETHDVSDIAAEIRHKSAEDDLESRETSNVADIAASVRKWFDGDPELDSELVETHNVSSIAKEIRLESAETIDVGKQAMRVREALKNGEVVPTAQVIKRGVRPMERPKEPESAIERLKEQGLFKPVPVIHREVNQNIESIQDLDDILPKSDVKTWDGGFVEDDDSNEATMSQNPQEVDEIRQVAMLVKAVQESEKRQESAHDEPQFAPVPGGAGVDIESRETIPIDLTSLPPEVVNGKSKKRHSSAKVESIDAEHTDAEEEEKAHVGLWITMIVILSCGIVYMLYLMGAFASISPALDPYHAGEIEVNENVDFSFDTLEDVSATIDAAAAIVNEAADFDSWMGSWLETKINQQSSLDDLIPYLEVQYACFSNEPEKLQHLIETCVEAGNIEKAKSYLNNKALSTEFVSKMKMKILLSNPKFKPEVQTLTEDVCDTIDPLGGGSTLTFKMKLNGENIGAFKPLQTRKQSNYRSEIAAWRLCELIECDFDIPWNRPIRIEHAMFDKLFSRSNSKKKASYRSELNDIIWTKDDGKTYVYGTLKDWVPDFTRFPIELTSFWKNWVSLENYVNEFKPLGDALSPLKHNKHTQKLYTEIMEQSPDLTTKALAAQISEVLVFDYLIGNWDRFSGVPDWWGVNCQYKGNKIVSIDNGAGFPSYTNDKVRDRYLMVERFSAHFIEALRGLDKEQTFKALFPEPSKRETECFEQFWNQRASVLSRVEKLCEKYGAEKVLSL